MPLPVSTGSGTVAAFRQYNKTEGATSYFIGEDPSLSEEYGPEVH